MTQTLEALERKTRSMSGIRDIVHTMKTLSAINAVPYESAARSIDHYLDVVLQAMHALLSAKRQWDLTITDTTARALLVFGSDHGLCGNYNERLADELENHGERGAQDANLAYIVCVGDRMSDALHSRGKTPATVLLTPANTDGLARLAWHLVGHIDKLRTRAADGEIGVELLFTTPASDDKQSIRLQRLLPLEPELVNELSNKPWDSTSLPWFRDSGDHLLATLIRHYLFASIYRAAADAMATENASRLARMQQAERSVDDQLLNLHNRTNVARQTQITEELLDVITGFEALR